MNDLEKHVLQIIGEDTTSPDVFSDITPIRDSVNSGIQELCAVTGSFKMVYHLPLYLDRWFYRMAWNFDHFGYVIEAWDRARKFKLQRTDIHTLRQVEPSFLQLNGPPERYFEIGDDVIGFDRAPGASGPVLELTCVAIPKAVATDADPVKVRDVYARAAVYYAVSEFYAGRGDGKRATDFYTKYLETAQIMHIHPEQADRLYQIGKDLAKWGPSIRR